MGGEGLGLLGTLECFLPKDICGEIYLQICKFGFK